MQLYAMIIFLELVHEEMNFFLEVEAEGTDSGWLLLLLHLLV